MKSYLNPNLNLLHSNPRPLHPKRLIIILIKTLQGCLQIHKIVRNVGHRLTPTTSSKFQATVVGDDCSSEFARKESELIFQLGKVLYLVKRNKRPRSKRTVAGSSLAEYQGYMLNLVLARICSFRGLAEKLLAITVMNHPRVAVIHTYRKKNRKYKFK